MSIIDYAEVRKHIGSDRCHLLLGNGFSVACNPVFKYESLYERAVEKGLSPRAQQVFARLGTNNFEGVMHLLDNTHWAARVYGLVDGDKSDMLNDLQVVKTALVDAIADSHLANVGDVGAQKLASGCAFLGPYYNVFTTNYDLLTYWAVMAREGGPLYRDGFGEDPDEPDAPHVVYSFRVGKQQGLFYLHGALHLFADEGQASKHCWSRSGEALTALIRRGLAQGQYPLFVAEGTSDKKLEQIRRSSYLSYALEKFGRVEKHLVVFGSSLGESDDHIRRAIAHNKALKNLYISARGGNADHAEQATAAINFHRRMRGHSDLNVRMFDADSASCWGTSNAKAA